MGWWYQLAISCGKKKGESQTQMRGIEATCCWRFNGIPSKLRPRNAWNHPHWGVWWSLSSGLAQLLSRRGHPWAAGPGRQPGMHRICQEVLNHIEPYWTYWTYETMHFFGGYVSPKPIWQSSYDPGIFWTKNPSDAILLSVCGANHHPVWLHYAKT